MHLTSYAKLAICILIVSIASVACGSPEESNAPYEVTIILDKEMQIEPRQVDQEVVPQNNCDGTADAENTITRSRSIQRILKPRRKLK